MLNKQTKTGIVWYMTANIFLNNYIYNLKTFNEKMRTFILTMLKNLTKTKIVYKTAIFLNNCIYNLMN